MLQILTRGACFENVTRTEGVVVLEALISGEGRDGIDNNGVQGGNGTIDGLEHTSAAITSG